jgi:choline dehydrogenase
MARIRLSSSSAPGLPAACLPTAVRERRYTVCLLEAGGSDLNFWIWMPIGYGKAFYNKRINWMYSTEPDPGLNDRSATGRAARCLAAPARSMPWSISAASRRISTTGRRWAIPAGAGTMSCPIFRGPNQRRRRLRLPRRRRPAPCLQHGQVLHPLCASFLAAGEQAGYQSQCGFQRRRPGRRRPLPDHGEGRLSHVDGRAYLSSGEKAWRMSRSSPGRTTRILMEGGAPPASIYCQGRPGNDRQRAREVILSAGAVNSPQILMLSGIGARSRARGQGHRRGSIERGVGQNLQDHLGLDYLYRSKVPTLNQQLYPWWGKLAQGIRYVLTRGGPLSLSVNQAGGFVKTRPECDRGRTCSSISRRSATPRRRGQAPAHEPGSRSRVSCSAFSRRARPAADTSRCARPIPSMRRRSIPTRSSTDHDLGEMVEGCKIMRRIAESPAMQSVIETEITPGPSRPDGRGHAGGRAHAARRSSTRSAPAGWAPTRTRTSLTRV